MLGQAAQLRVVEEVRRESGKKRFFFKFPALTDKQNFVVPFQVLLTTHCFHCNLKNLPTTIKKSRNNTFDGF